MKNLDEFLEKTKPGAKKSRLHDFLPELKSLRERNYTLNQLREFLLENGVVISIPWLSAFLRMHITSYGTSDLSNAEKPVPVSSATSVVDTPARKSEIDLLNKTSIPGFGKAKYKPPTTI